jgi:aldose 1-epimerase
MKNNQSAFDKEIDGKQVELFRIENENGLYATITNYGARVVELCVPDKSGNYVDVSIGFDNIAAYLASSEPYYGATIGRFGNRIAGGKFEVDGVSYQVTPNNGSNALHGGKHGFQEVVWDAEPLGSSAVRLTYLSEDMEEGFPGNLNVTVSYEFTTDNALRISYSATTDKTTPINLTNHTYFNLNGLNAQPVLNHLVEIHADQYIPINSDSIPFGPFEQVKGGPFDFTTARTIGDQIGSDHEQITNGQGYDHTFVLNAPGGTEAVAIAIGDLTGIRMEVFTDQPGLQFYTGNVMEGKNTIKGGRRDEYRTAFCMETQHFPDSPNQPGYPSTLLKPGEEFQSVTMYRFTVAR